MSNPVDLEIDAIRQVLAALQPLTESARLSVLGYVTKRLGVPLGGHVESSGGVPASALPLVMDRAGTQEPSHRASYVHIKEFKDQKKPRSANEMAAVVAYYLENIEKAEKRKDAISNDDIKTYFKIAEFPLPKTIRVTLQNAKNAGYLDAVGDGSFKLNAVGHNLVVHRMPRGSSRAADRPKRKGRSKKKRR